jgi:hypothetical protein
MIAILICILAMVACYWAGRRSVGQGLVMLLAFGYFYGILRANLQTTFSHFIFDAGMIGLFLSPKWRTKDPVEKKKSEMVQLWTILLIGWPVLLLALPFQPLLISLVGLRGNIFFLPLLLIGSRLKEKDLIELSVGMAILDMVAVAFGGAEYFLGVPRFFPFSSVTLIMYSSGDVAGGFLRIPAVFTSAHAFGNTMVATLPYIVGLWTRSQKRSHRMLALLALPVALLGVLMSATRTNFVFASAMILFAAVTSKMTGKQRAVFVVVLTMVGAAALTNTRFQRFQSLKDTDYITDRIAGSVNRGFWEILVQYPMGNGLGGGGTSIPYFLEGQVRNPVAMENEYARILSEQGIIGLLLWLGFVAWVCSRFRTAFAAGPWAPSRRLVWCLVMISLGTAFLGTGTLTSIPATLLMILGIGWTAVPETPSASTQPEQVRLRFQRPRNYAGVSVAKPS